MFNWIFGKPEYVRPERWAPEIPTWKTGQIDSDENGYTVGKTPAGETVMKMTGDGITTTMTLTENGVRQLIRMLESTIDEEK